MIFDSHSHTRFSADSEMTAADALAAAQEAGVGLVFTEHLDFDYPDGWNFEFDPAAYWREYSPYRGDRLRLGVEVGMQAATCERSRDFVKKIPFDMVIGSVHLLDGEDIYTPEFYTGRAQDDVYPRYFAAMAALVRQHDFIDALGHIDYICRVAPYPNPGVNYRHYREAIDEVLRAAVLSDTVLELNTRRINQPGVAAELLPVYRRYREIGGRYATVGSDAHKPNAVGAFLDEALDFLAAADLIPVTFCARQMEIMKR